MVDIIFRNPHFLWALLVVPVIIIIHFVSLRYSRGRAVKFANFIALARVSEKVGISSNYPVLVLRVLVLIVIVFSIAGTSLVYQGKTLDADYVIAIDASSSMLAEDLDPTRFVVAKESAVRFVDNLNYIYSSVAIVSFSGTPFVHQILSKSKVQLKEAISELEARQVGGTDLGSAIIASSNILIASEKPKIIILVTDGRDNIGLDYRDGIRYANDNNIAIFTVGIGTEGGFAEGENNLLGPLGIDESQLREIAEFTDGQYFNVQSRQDLENVYFEILGTEEKKVTLDLTFFLLLAVLSLLVLEWVLVNTRYRIIP